MWYLMTVRTTFSSPDDWQRWLTLAAAAAALGLLPRAWQKTLGTAAAALWLLKRL